MAEDKEIENLPEDDLKVAKGDLCARKGFKKSPLYKRE